MSEVFIVTWINEFDGDLEMYVAETREIASDFSSHLEENGIDCKVHSRPVQDEGIIDRFSLVTADYSGGMAA